MTKYALMATFALLAVLTAAMPSAAAQTTDEWSELAVLDPVPLGVDGGHAGLEMDPITGLFHVTNTTTSRIDIVDHTGALVESYGLAMVGGLTQSWPVDVEFMDDTIYVSYFHAGAVVAYDRATLAVKAGIASVSGLNGPVGIDAADGEVYVAERGGKRVRVYDASLNFLRWVTVELRGWPGCTISPNDVAVHGDGLYILSIYVPVAGITCQRAARGVWRSDRNFGSTTSQYLFHLSAYLESPAFGYQLWYSIEVATDGTLLLADGGSGSEALLPGLTVVVPTAEPTVIDVPLSFSAPTGLTVDPDGTSIWLLARPPAGGDRMLFPTTLELCDGKAPTILGTPGPNSIELGSEPEVVWSGAGDDVVSATGGNQTVCTGAGDDTVETGDGLDRIRGGPGDDMISAGAGIDRIWGNAGNDEIHGDGGSDRIWAGDNNDMVFAGSGADRVWGGPGDDTLNGMGGQDFMYGQEGNDVMQGNWQSDRLWGGPGNDRLAGAQGKDRLWGEAGDDELFGGVNTDYLNGGDGYDRGNGQQGKDNPLVPGVSGCEQLQERVSC